jgi:hypothetical protein
MGHPLTEEEQECLAKSILYYNKNKVRFLYDMSLFLLVSAILFYIIVLIQI